MFRDGCHWKTIRGPGKVSDKEDGSSYEGSRHSSQTGSQVRVGTSLQGISQWLGVDSEKLRDLTKTGEFYEHNFSIGDHGVLH